MVLNIKDLKTIHQQRTAVESSQSLVEQSENSYKETPEYKAYLAAKAKHEEQETKLTELITAYEIAAVTEYQAGDPDQKHLLGGQIYVYQNSELIADKAIRYAIDHKHPSMLCVNKDQEAEAVKFLIDNNMTILLGVKLAEAKKQAKSVDADFMKELPPNIKFRIEKDLTDTILEGANA